MPDLGRIGLACPACGGSPVMLHHQPSTHGLADSFSVICDRCGAKTDVKPPVAEPYLLGLGLGLNDRGWVRFLKPLVRYSDEARALNPEAAADRDRHVDRVAGASAKWDERERRWGALAKAARKMTGR